jgi:transcription elongation factor SPT6
MTTANLFDLDAELGSEEDEEFEGEEEAPRARKQKANIDDSSEEEEDDDEEAEREVRMKNYTLRNLDSNQAARSVKVS